jgi:hypothetical protein
MRTFGLILVLLLFIVDAICVSAESDNFLTPVCIENEELESDLIFGKQELNVHDFGFVFSGDTSSYEYHFSNPSHDDYIIDSIIITKTGCCKFGYFCQSALPDTLHPLDALFLRIYCVPEAIGSFQDTLTINFHNNKSPVKLQYVLKAKSLANTNIFFRDTTADVGTKNYHLPIKARFTDANVEGISNVNFEISLNFNSTLFYPESVSNGEIIENKVINGKRFLKIKGVMSNLSNIESNVTEIIGLVLIGNATETTINITSCTWQYNWIHSDLTGGMFKLAGSCQLPLSSVIIYPAPKSIIHIKNNPIIDKTSAEIDIETNETGQIFLGFYSYNGILLYSSLWTRDTLTDGPEIYSFLFDLTNISNGVYYFVLHTPSGIQSAQCRIIK